MILVQPMPCGAGAGMGAVLQSQGWGPGADPYYIICDEINFLVTPF